MAERRARPRRRDELPADGSQSRQMRTARTLAWATAALAVAAAVAFAIASGVSHPRPAPPLPGHRLAGPRVSIASLHGSPALVLFWASWCRRCGEEAAAVRSFAQSPSGEGRIVGVDWADRPRAARAFVRRHRWGFSNVRDASGEVGLSYGVTRLPALFVIDSHGDIYRALSGIKTQRDLEVALRSARGR
jgi:cytochrome c biogenesis protein CcmG, thiol:disulfide interchange protein DsbE